MTRDRLFEDYASYHRDACNQVCHAFGIPLIVMGLFGLLALLRLGPIDVAVVAGLVVLVYYAALDVRGAAIAAIAFLVLYEIGVHLPWELNLAALVLGWGFQLVGHRLEGNRPRFLGNLVYLLVGPLFFFEEGAGMLLSMKRAT